MRDRLGRLVERIQPSKIDEDGGGDPIGGARLGVEVVPVFWTAWRLR